MKNKIKKMAAAIAVAFALTLPASAQTFGGVQTNFATVQCPTNSGYAWTNIYYLGLPTKTLIVTNLWTQQSNFTASWVIYRPASTNIITVTGNFGGGTNLLWQTNVSVYLPQTNYFFFHADPGTNGGVGGGYFTNGLFVN